MESITKRNIRRVALAVLVCGVATTARDAHATSIEIEPIYEGTVFLSMGGLSDGQLSFSDQPLGLSDDSEQFLYDGQGVLRLTDNAYDDGASALEGGSLFWLGQPGSSEEVFFWDGAAAVQLTNDGLPKAQLDTDGAGAVWVVDDGNDLEIVLYDGQQVVQLTNNGYDDSMPSIDGGNVAWSGWPDDQAVFFWDGASTTRLSPVGEDHGQVRLEDGVVVWTGAAVGQDREVFRFDGVTTTQLTDDAVEQTQPNVSAGVVAWLVQTGPGGGDLWVHEGGTATRISQAYETLLAPQMSEGNLAWAETVPGAGAEVFAYIDGDILRITDDGAVQSDVRIDGDQIAWRQDSQDLYLATVLGPALAQLRLQYANGESSNDVANTISPSLRIVNDGDAPVELGDIEVRYWYTAENSTAQQLATNYAVDESTWQPLGAWPYPDVQGAFVTTDPAAPGAGTALVLSFAEDAGAVQPGSAVRVQLTVHGAGWGNYDEADDYSGILGQSSFVDQPNIAVYHRGLLVWGQEP